MAYLNALLQHSPRNSEENHENLNQDRYRRTSE